uniref:Uncharacterized protein n=1 Tax=Sphaerodactylus townsendi TaxID=933632 RepID=A0ACB8FR47_9SAUR
MMRNTPSKVGIKPVVHIASHDAKTKREQERPYTAPDPGHVMGQWPRAGDPCSFGTELGNTVPDLLRKGCISNVSRSVCTGAASGASGHTGTAHLFNDSGAVGTGAASGVKGHTRTVHLFYTSGTGHCRQVTRSEYTLPHLM